MRTVSILAGTFVLLVAMAAAIVAVSVFDQADAAPPATQKREAQIAIGPGPVNYFCCADGWRLEDNSTVSFDPSEFPAGATVRFEAIFPPIGWDKADGCARLLLLDSPASVAGTPVVGSELC